AGRGREERSASVGARDGEANEVEQRRCDVDDTAHLRRDERLFDEARGDHEERDMHVLFVDELRVPEIALVLIERLSVTDDDHPEGPSLEPARGDPVDELSQREIAPVEVARVRVDGRGVPERARAWARRVIRVMAGDRGVDEEEALASGAGVDEREGFG